VTTPEPSHIGIDIRSYGARRTGDRHAFAQLVLPIAGDLRLDIEDRPGRLDPLHGAVIAAGAWHEQCSLVANRSVIVDIDQATLQQDAWACLLERPFTPIGPAARKLVEFAELMNGSLDGRALRGWVPLLLDTLAAGSPRPASRLTALLARIDADLAAPWTTASMADVARISVSRLHALFQQELDTSPHAWLLARRIDAACRELATSNRPIADVALAAGFADQAALTRALRRQRDVTPAAYRRASQENLPKTQ
jgi:AraC-like DNA-binding protein